MTIDRDNLRHPRTRELLEYLDAQRRVLRDAFDAVPSAAREQLPEKGGWSPTGVIEHLAIVEDRISARVSAALTDARAAGLQDDREKGPILPTLDVTRVEDRSTRVSAPEAAHPTGLDTASAWRALEANGDKVREALVSADGLDLAAVSVPHPRFGPMTLYQWFAFVGAHEARHAAQIREISAAPSAR